MSATDFRGLQVPAALDRLAADVHTLGGRAFLVGGGVRDHLLGKAFKDFDVEVHGVPTHELERLLNRLGRVNAVGRSFGVFKLRPRGSAPDLPEIDVSIPRRDSNSGPGHKGIAVEGDPTMSLDEAVRRRDLTINALLVDLRTRELEDRVGGVDDLRNARLRAVDASTFLDDPLRALRMVQFAARTGFRPDAPLLDLCRRAPIDELPPERIQLEWAKLLLRGRYIELGLGLARDTAILERVFPELVDAPALDAVLQSAVGVRDGLEATGPQWVLMLALWLSQSPLDAAEATLDRLCLHTVARYPARKTLLSLLERLDAPIADATDLRRLSVTGELRLALAVREALVPGSTRDAWPVAHALDILREGPPRLLMGRDLAAVGVRGGPRMGQLLAEAYEAQLQGTLSTKEAALEWAHLQLGS